MREKRRGKKVFDNSSKVSLVNEQISFVNGLYCEDIKKSVITTNSVNNSKLAEKWNAMDYEKYFMYRYYFSVYLYFLKI